MKPEEHELLSRTAAGTPMGDLLRRFWMPALLSREVEKDGAPLRVRLLGEDLIAFRDTNGKVGLVDAFCPHRRAPMFFGRNEECGLRCVYHGWKFDRSGACVDMPSEPADSLFKTKATRATIKFGTTLTPALVQPFCDTAARFKLLQPMKATDVVWDGK